MLKIGVTETKEFLEAQYNRAYPIFKKLLDASVYQMPFFKDYQYELQIASVPLETDNFIGVAFCLYDKYGVKIGLKVQVDPFCIALSSDVLIATLLGHEIMHFIHNDDRGHYITNYILKQSFHYEKGNDADEEMHRIVQSLLLRGSEASADILGILLAKKAGYVYEWKHFHEFYKSRSSIQRGRVEFWKHSSPSFGMLDWNHFFEEIHPTRYEHQRFSHALINGVYPQEYGYRFYNFWDMEELVNKYMYRVVDKSDIDFVAYNFIVDAVNILREIMELNRKLYRQIQTIQDYETLLAIWSMNYSYEEDLEDSYKEVPKLEVFKKIHKCMVASCSEMKAMMRGIENRIIGDKTRDELEEEWERIRPSWISYHYLRYIPVPYVTRPAVNFRQASRASDEFLAFEIAGLRKE